MPKVSRLKFLRDYLRTVEPHGFSLKYWLCKTTACAVGHGALNPVFNAQGLHLSGSELFLKLPRPIRNLKSVQSWHAVELFFGLTTDEAMFLFNSSQYPNKDDTSLQEVIDRLSSYISKVDGEQVIAGSYVTLYQIPNGDLSIRLNHDYFCELDRDHLKQHLASLHETLEDIVGNSSYELLTTDQLGGMGEAPIFAEVSWDEDDALMEKPKIIGASWYFHKHYVEDPFDTLVQDGEVIFTTTPEYEKKLKQERGGVLCNPIPLD